MALTDTTLRAVKPSEKLQKLFDGNGLFLAVSPSGTKSWRLKYYHAGKEKLLTLGQYPTVSLKDARERAMEAKKVLSAGKDPSVEKRIAKQEQRNTFEIVAREWLEKQTPVWKPKHAAGTLRRLERHLLPTIGSRPIADISAPELLAMLRKIEAKGHVAQAHIIHRICGAVFRYAVATGRAERDPAADIRGALTPHTTTPMPAITDPDKIGCLLIKIDDYPGMSIRCAMQFMAHTFCRISEICLAEWSEFDFSDMLWRIPGTKMKMARDHLVPISNQVKQLLDSIKEHSGLLKYVFPSPYSADAHISDNGIRKAMMYMGIGQDEMTPHGFRAMASTLLNEHGYNPDVIERQLAHVPHQYVRGIYNRAEYLPERRKMMQDWSDYLTALRDRARQGNVSPRPSIVPAVMPVAAGSVKGKALRAATRP
ncbi:MAG: tyrosine-type recombinase/integrase [Desulfovibrio sp.]|jgi:integrase|nr:tyrosine-type recombinase/integrase [Desulfovibrio sp.]